MRLIGPLQVAAASLLPQPKLGRFSAASKGVRPASLSLQFHPIMGPALRCGSSECPKFIPTDMTNTGRHLGASINPPEATRQRHYLIHLLLLFSQAYHRAVTAAPSPPARDFLSDVLDCTETSCILCLEVGKARNNGFHGSNLASWVEVACSHIRVPRRIVRGFSANRADGHPD